MSFNVGGIYIDPAKPIPASRVAAAITKYWTGKGAKVENDDPKTLGTLSVEKTKKLGYAVLSSGGKIAIADSERYTADHGLAQFLAKELKAPVFWYGLYGATDAGISAWFGAKRSAPSGYDEVQEYVSKNFAPPFVYLQELKAKKGDVFLSFSNVRAYDEGPDPEDEEEDDDGEGEASPAGGGSWVIDPKKKMPFAPIRAGKKKKAARDNLVIAFYCRSGGPKPKGDVFAKVFQAYQRVIPNAVLRWALVGGSSTDVRLMKPGALARAEGQFKKKGGFFFFASDDDPKKPQKDEPSVPAYAFVAAVADESAEATRLELRFPSELVWQVGADEIVRFATEQVATLGDALVSGSCSIALTPFPLISGERDGYAVYAEAKKHRGLDVLSDNTDELGSRVRPGVRWVDFLGPTLAKKLSAKGLAGVEKIGNALSIRSSQEPAIDPDTATLKRMRAVAKALDPITAYGDRLVELDAEDEDLEAWERRFL